MQRDIALESVKESILWLSVKNNEIVSVNSNVLVTQLKALDCSGMRSLKGLLPLDLTLGSRKV